MALGIFAVAFENRSLPPYTRVRWRGMVRCGAFATKARKSMIVETSFADALVRGAPIAYDGPVYARVDAARWSRDCTQIQEFLGLFNVRPCKFFSVFLVRVGHETLCGRAEKTNKTPEINTASFTP